MTKERSTRAINPTGEMRLQILVKSKTSQFLKSLLSVSTLMGPSGYGGGGGGSYIDEKMFLVLITL